MLRLVAWLVRIVRGTDTESQGSDFWSGVTDDQRIGVYAESGGITRAEQEQALEDIQEQADRIERRR